MKKAKKRVEKRQKKKTKKVPNLLSVFLVDNRYRFLSVVSSLSFQSRFGLSFLLGLTSLVSLLAKVWLQFKSDNTLNKLGKHLTLLCFLLYIVCCIMCYRGIYC